MKDSSLRARIGRVYDLVHLALWSLLIAFLLFFALVVLPNVPGRQATQRRLPCRAKRGDLEDLCVGAVVTGLPQRRLPGNGERGIYHPAGVLRGQVHLRLAVRIRAGQFGKGTVEPRAAREGPADDHVALVRPHLPVLALGPA